MDRLLADVRDGSFATRWIEENRAGRPEFDLWRARDVDHPIERVGRELRRMMPFVGPKEVVPGAGGA
jgi:ketol-acid reductoisomerase